VEDVIGTVSHYWGNIGVAGIELTAGIRVGNTIRIVGATTDFTQSVDSLQIDHAAVDSAAAGDSVGVKVAERARVGDQVLLAGSG
jgi:translation elongation factor EF-Tu-like GTPase